MFTTEDILKMIESGKSVDDIAKEFTDRLNEANAIQESKKNQARRLEDAADLLEFAIDFINDYYPTIAALIEDVTITPETIVEFFDAMAKDKNFMTQMKMLKSLTKTFSSVESKSDEDAIDVFLRKHGL